jgi:subtilisin-like proprotein convertase family protein
MLSQRADVAWVEWDGTKKILATPQDAQILINSDQTNTIGFTGTGQAIAILDTGVDYTVASLGGGSFPNSKVIGGTDIADNDSDPQDCEGHGTDVASVAAGPTGVAPDAKIVAVKVFSSKSASNAQCSDEAKDSDILGGINYSITNRAAFGITVINMSIGGAFTDGAAHGYCDADEPAYASAIDSATAAGILVAVASGNDGTTNAIAVPACISSAVSAGAVYPDSHVRVTWSDGMGGVQCVDSPVVADQIPCFSDSNSNLSLLAPGAFWLVAGKGGGLDVFHGTSASAPAVAGAAVLMHQARPDLTPAGIAGVLRATGKPITDSRNGVVTPRIDTLAAVQIAAGSFSSWTGVSAAIPDGTSVATATTTVTGFSGSVASVEAWVEIDHPDPPQLRVTLIGPDGTSVVLQDHTGQPQHPINAIYGKTTPSAQSLGAFQAKPGNGVWTLKVEDTVVGTAGRIRNFAVILLSGQPVEPIPAQVSGDVLPVVAHVFGTKFFKSDVRVYNPDTSSREFSLYYVAPGQNGSTAVKATATVGPAQVLALNDVIASEFHYSDSIGPMTVTTSDQNFLVTSRAYTQGANGTFGLFVPGFTTTGGLSLEGGTATANGLSKTAQFHTNVGFTEVSGSPVSVRIDIRDSNGILLATTTAAADKNTTFLITDVIKDRGLPLTSNFRVDFTVVSPTGRIIPFATYVDDATGDGSYQAAVNPSFSAGDILIPQTAHVTGADADFFKTNLNITNLNLNPVTITVSLIPLILTGSPNPPRVYTIAPGQTLEKIDLLASEFGLGDPSAAGLRIHPSGAARLAVSVRTYVEKFGGTFGSSVPALTASDSLDLVSGRVGTVIQLDQTTDPIGYRSNFGFTEVAGGEATVTVTVKSGDTGSTLGTKSYPISANSSFQASVSDILGTSTTASNIYLQFAVTAGAGRVVAYAATVDNQSGDTIFMSAQ